MDWISAASAAEVLAVSPERVRQLINSGRLDARRIAGRWLVDQASVTTLAHERRQAGRPWSPPRAWGLLALAAGRTAPWLRAAEIRHLRDVLADRRVEDVAFQLRQRADSRRWYVHPEMLNDLLGEDGVVVGGARASGKLRDSGPIDLYIADAVLGRLVGAYAPDQQAQQPNVIARVVRAPWPFAPGEQKVWPEVAAVDLLERGGDSRASRVARELLARA